MLPYWVKVVRAGDVLTAYMSADGTTWTKVGSNRTIPMTTDPITVGLVVFSGNITSTRTATIDNVSVTTP